MLTLQLSKTSTNENHFFTVEAFKKTDILKEVHLGHKTNGPRNLEYRYIIGCIFILPHVWLPETLSLKIFQYNYPIFKSGLKETELCTFCSETEK
jgi:hypothetical protein